MSSQNYEGDHHENGVSGTLWRRPGEHACGWSPSPYEEGDPEVGQQGFGAGQEQRLRKSLRKTGVTWWNPAPQLPCASQVFLIGNFMLN